MFGDDTLADLIPFKYYSEKAKNILLDEHKLTVKIFRDDESTITFSKDR